jgi:hypothetical protein
MNICSTPPDPKQNSLQLFMQSNEFSKRLALRLLPVPTLGNNSAGKDERWFFEIMGNKDLIKYIASHQSGYKIEDIKNANWVAQNGYFELLRLYQHLLWISDKTILWCAFRGRFDIVKWLFTRRKNTCIGCVRYAALLGYKTTIVNWLERKFHMKKCARVPRKEWQRYQNQSDEEDSIVALNDGRRYHRRHCHVGGSMHSISEIIGQINDATHDRLILPSVQLLDDDRD